MTLRFIDTHCHFDFPPFEDNETASIARASQAGVGRIIVPSISASESLPLLFRCLNAFESLSVKDEKAAIMGNSLAATREIAVLGTTLFGECAA